MKSIHQKDQKDTGFILLRFRIHSYQQAIIDLRVKIRSIACLQQNYSSAQNLGHLHITSTTVTILHEVSSTLVNVGTIISRPSLYYYVICPPADLHSWQYGSAAEFNQ